MMSSQKKVSLSDLLMSFLSTNGNRKQQAEALGFLRTWNNKQIWITQSCMIFDLTPRVGSGRVKMV